VLGFFCWQIDRVAHARACVVLYMHYWAEDYLFRVARWVGNTQSYCPHACGGFFSLVVSFQYCIYIWDSREEFNRLFASSSKSEYYHVSSPSKYIQFSLFLSVLSGLGPSSLLSVLYLVLEPRPPQFYPV
jgi:hypothetical protein